MAEKVSAFLQHCWEDIWKLVGLVGFVCAGLAGHYDILPPALQAHKEWFEFLGFVGGLVNAYRMTPQASSAKKEGQ